MKGLYHQNRLKIWSLLIAVTCVATSSVSLNAEVLNWKFKVYLDKKAVGEHDYQITTENGLTQVETTASFDVKILFINAFRYRHSNTEVWDDNGMVSIDALTKQNGKEFVVRGKRENGVFIVSDGEEEQELPENLKSFGYWNPAILNEGQLLNSQTADFEPVEIVELGSDRVDYQGQSLAARKYEIRLPKAAITVWYGAECSRWLALESPAKGGRVIRYEPLELPNSVEFSLENLERMVHSDT